MFQIGYALSSEEHTPNELVSCARRAEEAGFTFALISDHYHPWIDRQGQSPFVWSVIGGIAHTTTRLHLGTGVTCPTMRIHPAIVAQAAATAAAMMPGRFFLGLGSGENLNEHILGQRWPSADIRREMLEEAIQVLRALWSGELTTHRGRRWRRHLLRRARRLRGRQRGRGEADRARVVAERRASGAARAGAPATGALRGRRADGDARRRRGSRRLRDGRRPPPRADPGVRGRRLR